jgi:hypothetical protein
MARGRRLKQFLAASRRTADQAQASMLRAEDALTVLEDREARRAERAQQQRADVTRRMPAVGGRH